MKDSSAGGGGGGGGGALPVPATETADTALVMTHQSTRNRNGSSADAAGIRCRGLLCRPIVKFDIVLQHLHRIARRLIR